jgi:FKBP-type peptidyl-prolyl cis-trans isomerase SlyD
MQIGKNKVVSMDYTLTDNSGKVIDTSKGREPLSYLHGGGGIIPGLENALEGKAKGDQVKVKVSPEQGYGVRNENQVQDVPISAFIRPGMQVQAQTAQGPRVVTVVSVPNGTVKIDANHPLAGVELNFDVKITDIREATAEEVQHGHAHGPGGHHHH